MIRLLTEVLALLAGQLDFGIHNLGRKIWTIAFGIGIAVGSVFLLFIGIAFLGFALYHHLVLLVGATLAAFIVGGFFILVSLILLLISKKMIKRKT